MANRPNKYDPAKILLEVSRAVSSSLDFDKVRAMVLKESRKALGTDHASLFLMDDTLRHLTLSGVDGFSENEIDNIKLIGSWEVIGSELLRGRVPFVVNDIHKDPIFKNKKLPFVREKLPIQSFMAAPLEKDGKIIGILIVSNKKRPDNIFSKEDEELLMALSNNIGIAVLNAKLYRDLRSLFISTITALTRAIDAKDTYTSGHSERVMKYSVAIAGEMALDEELIEHIGLASLLHDVGKIGVKESILMKPAKLLGYERRQVKQHPGIGARIIESIDGSYKILRGVLEHHERWDGKGYPSRLREGGISLEGRIIAVADAFDALTTDRPYQKGHSRKKAFEVIKRGASKQFDPKVVEAFISSYQKNPAIWSAAS
jgi:HD-GYP domain-containing protein (c-di-GMP phosphodiesterase class II)